MEVYRCMGKKAQGSSEQNSVPAQNRFEQQVVELSVL
jgi:hypothetical protein